MLLFNNKYFTDLKTESQILAKMRLSKHCLIFLTFASNSIFLGIDDQYIEKLL